MTRRTYDPSRTCIAEAGARDAGASETLARVLPVLQEAVRIGPEVTRDLRLGVEVPRFVTLSYSGSACTALVDAAAIGGLK